LAVTLLDNRAIRRDRRLRDLATIRRNCLDQQRVAVRHPLDGLSHDRVELDAFKAHSRGARAVPKPELDSIHRSVGESKLLSIRRPHRRAQVSVGRQSRNFARLTRRYIHQAERREPWRMMSSVRRWIDAQPGNAEHGLGQVSDGRILQPVGHQKPIRTGADQNERSRRSAEKVVDGFWSLVVLTIYTSGKQQGSEHTQDAIHGRPLGINFEMESVNQAVKLAFSTFETEATGHE